MSTVPYTLDGVGWGIRLEVSRFQVLKRICFSLIAEGVEVPASVRSAGFLQIDLH